MSFNALQDHLFVGARNIRKTEEVMPIAFILTNEGAFIPMPLIMPKDRWRNAILGGIETFDGIGVVLHSEAWSTDDPLAVKAKLNRPDLMTRDLPGAVEELCSSMELKDGSTRIIRAPIENGIVGKSNVFAGFDMEIYQGELTGFFRVDRHNREAEIEN